MKAWLAAFIVFGGAPAAVAQSLPAVYLNEQNQATVPDSATHYRVVEQHPEGSLYPMREYAMNGTLLLRGFLTSIDPPLRSGTFVGFHPNGAKASQVHFQDDRPEGLYVSWYEDGKVQERGEYHHGERTGRWLSVHRNGQRRSTGNYTSDRPTGEWHYYYSNGQPAAVEVIRPAQPTALTLYNEDGSRFDGLPLRRQAPEFPGGEPALLEYLARHTNYPREARRKGITGKVYVSYTVGEDGRVGQVRVLRGLSPDADNEAKRVVASLPRFRPGREYNVPTSFTYTVPIYFAPQFSLFGGPKPPPSPPVEARANW
ncbi:TonB family protein [Hymenobacter sp. 15J16-1T3B]|uniref:energy transducer TonB n=1 Tax=Hymenobacter sp. 15J16-1T3B TaxID=2886941 RepID=UPI001D117AB5|nr:energy transducer TonB [Hymenobacter sp. 15J16-1T3B]MCC3159121.1 TonB family protein [Hymenobacter sp. 15J16-1T3B]